MATGDNHTPRFVDTMLYDAFLTYLRCELNLSAHTVSSYTCDLNQWRSFADERLGRGFDPAGATVNDLRLWVASLSARGLSARSIRRKIQTLRAFYRYLNRRHGYLVNPAMELAPARMPKRLPETIRPEETERILDAPWDHDDFVETRNRLIIDMLYSTGMRASELAGLTDAAVDTVRGELKVLGKRNKERIIPFGNEMTQLITLYRSLRPAGQSARFFVAPDGTPLQYRHVWQIVRGALTGRVRASRPTPHALRHSFATDMLNGGAELTAVQKLLGHASLATTQIYTHLSYSELQHNYQLAHPRAQKKG